MDGDDLNDNGAMRLPGSGVNRHIGSRLQALRKTLGMSQTEMGTMIGVSQQQERKYENGSDRLSAASLYICSRRAGLNVGYFFEGLTSNGAAEGFAEEGTGFAVDAAVPSDEDRLLDIFGKLKTKAEREQAITLVERVAENFENNKELLRRAMLGLPPEPNDDDEPA